MLPVSAVPISDIKLNRLVSTDIESDGGSLYPH